MNAKPATSIGRGFFIWPWASAHFKPCWNKVSRTTGGPPVFIQRMAILSVVGMGLFIWQELHTAHPAVDLRVLRHRSLAAGSIISLAGGHGALWDGFRRARVCANGAAIHRDQNRTHARARRNCLRGGDVRAGSVAQDFFPTPDDRLRLHHDDRGDVLVCHAQSRHGQRPILLATDLARIRHGHHVPNRFPL